MTSLFKSKADLPPFREDASCPKCGHATVGTGYHSEGGMNSSSPCYYITGEHIDRTCQRCGYSWAEAPLAAPVSVLTGDTTT